MTDEGSRVLQVRAVLIAELRSGSRRPGAPINVKETSQRLRVSATPVREALERLVGEGMVSATGDRHGFAAMRLRPRELVGHHELLGLLVEHAVRATGFARPLDPLVAVDPDDPAAAVERVLERVLAGSARPVLLQEARRLGSVVASYRRFEPALIIGWKEELERISAAETPNTIVAAVRAFTRSRRMRAADIAEAAEQ